MADTIRIKRRTSGAPGSPGSLANAEIAFNEVDSILYYGKGTGGAGGSATTVIPIGGPGAFLPIAGGEITGALTVDGALIADSGMTVGDDSLNTTVLKVNGQPGSNRGLLFQTVSKNRWSVQENTAGESTGNVGSDFTIQAWNDAGSAVISTPLTISRATGVVTLSTGPVNAMDVANKAYVDSVAQGLDAKASARAATTGANITLSGLQTIDGVALAANDRVLVKDQTTAANNGIYTVQSGAWVRATDMDSWNEVPSAYVFIENGTTNADSGWLCTSDPGGTLNTTAIVWVQFSGAGQITAGAGLVKTGNVLDVGGTTNRITVGVDTVDIAATYAGQASIVTLGTITTGVWNGTPIAQAYVAGLGTMASQNANAVAITGGTIDNVTIDGGVF